MRIKRSIMETLNARLISHVYVFQPEPDRWNDHITKVHTEDETCIDFIPPRLFQQKFVQLR